MKKSKKWLSSIMALVMTASCLAFYPAKSVSAREDRGRILEEDFLENEDQGQILEETVEESQERIQVEALEKISDSIKQKEEERSVKQTFGDWEYVVEEDKVSQVSHVVLCKYTGTNAELVVIPEQINDIPVTTIGCSCFEKHKEITDIEWHNDITTIEPMAWAGCTGLSIIKDTKYHQVTSLGGGAFFECSKLPEPYFLDKIDDLQALTFMGCELFDKVIIPSNVKKMGVCAFTGCKKMTEVTIKGDMDSIGVMAFGLCEKLQTVRITGKVKEIPMMVFMLDEELTTVSLSSELERVGALSFVGCKKIDNVVLPETVTSIELGAFALCESLDNLTIPASVNEIGLGAFDETLWLKKQQEKSPLVQVNHILLDGQTATGNVTIPEDVTRIANGAFSGNDNLTGVTVPEGITEIPAGCFSSCSNLQSVSLPDSVTYINDAAFSNCNDTFVITAPADSAAAQFAKNNGLTQEARKQQEEERKAAEALRQKELAEREAKRWYDANAGAVQSRLATGKQTQVTQAAIPEIKKKVSGLKAKLKKNTIKLSWKKKSIAEGYYVYYGTKKARNKQKVVVISSKKQGCTLKKLKKNKKYYITVMAYCTYVKDGKKQFVFGPAKTITKKIK